MTTKKTANQNYTSQHKAYQNLKSFTWIIAFVAIALLITNVGTIFFMLNSVWVSIPGAKIKVEREMSDRYYETNAEKQVEDWVNLMFSFEPSSFEENLESAKHLSTNSLFSKYKAVFYDTPDKETGDPVYISWIENDILVDIETINIEHSYTKEGNLLITYTGKQTFKKAYDYYQRDEYEFKAEVLVKPIKSLSENNQRGFILTDYNIIDNKEVKSEN